MRHGKYQKRTISPVIWIVLILAVLGMSFGGARAYLSHSGGQVTNSFSTDNHPTITVGDDYSVTVTADYAVYLRAAVVVNWDNDNADTILAAKSGEYTLTPGPGWILHGNFYYYTQPVTKDHPVTPAIITNISGSKNGYTMKVDVALQAIQAIGTTDIGDTAAVTDAWGVEKSIFSTTN